jgi:pectin methylesterase-like acyl-CoA thioesterase
MTRSIRNCLVALVVGLASALGATEPAGAQTTLYVDDDNCPGPGDGSELAPYCSIQTAIDNAVDMDEIVVAPGTYFETIDFLGKAVTLKSTDGPEVTIIAAWEHFSTNLRFRRASAGACSSSPATHG